MLGAKTKTEKVNLESNTGVRFSELSRLSYFDPIRMSIINPMHNMYLGSAKHIIKVWLSTGTILEDSFETIQKRVDTIETPASLGKIPQFLHLLVDSPQNSGCTGLTYFPCMP